MKLNLMLGLSILFFSSANGQTKTLFASGLVLNDSINERKVRLEFDLERDHENRLYQRSSNKLVFQQPENWYYPFYEIYNDEFILVTNISEEMSVSSVYKYLAKYDVVIIDLKNLERQFICNMRGADFNGINMHGKELYVKLGAPVNEEIKCDVFYNKKGNK